MVWLCVANKAMQDPHPQRVEASGGHSCVSFDFGYAARFDGETKACGLYIHDRDTGAMHVIPTPQKGGKHLKLFEFYTFLTWLGHETISLKVTRNQPRSLCWKLSANPAVPLVSKLWMNVLPLVLSNGGAEVTVKVAVV